MRLRRLRVAGFRGFNSERTIEFHDQLTLISAPNSHGKTSIIEALEYLLYGQTSKVESADSKEEYKDSYENRHFPTGTPGFIEAHFTNTPLPDVVLRLEMDDRGSRRSMNGKAVAEWPFIADATHAQRPFVVQHSLRSLLLAAPSDRFQGFARLLGLREVDSIQQALVNLCTKPEAHMPVRAKTLLTSLSVFDKRLRSSKETLSIAKALSRGASGVPDAYAAIHSRGEKLIGKKVAEAELSAALVVLRNAAAERVFSGSIAIKPLTSAHNQRAAATRDQAESFLKPEFLDAYARLAVVDTSDRIRKAIQVLSLGIELLEGREEQCPFCEQSITEAIVSHAVERHQALIATLGSAPDIGALRTQMAVSLKELTVCVATNVALHLARARDLIAANSPESSQKIKALFGKGNEHALFLVAAAGAGIAPTHMTLAQTADRVAVSVQVCTDAIHNRAEELAQIEDLTKTLLEYLQTLDAYNRKIVEITPTLAEPSSLLQLAVDAQAGTSELSLLIELLSGRADVLRSVRIKDVLDGLKDLRKHIDQAVGKTMEEAFSTDLTAAVMSWYGRIRTTSDPDVHFSGFAMERTKSGDFKNRRVKVAARSYGVELASAVSSLSESKLNALGLCMSIATALRAPGPWEFLILDDPIQSWDDDHETQFIDIIRALVEEEGRQVVLMSHRDGWIDQVVAGCRSLNGIRYHITGYTKDGPSIQQSEWTTIDQRLREAISIAKDPNANAIRLQQAEEEIRIVACQLISEVARLKLRRTTGAHSMNSDKARTILNEAGCPAALVDRIIGTFTTTDPAHHAPKDYVANAKRVVHYHDTMVKLKQWLAAPVIASPSL